METEPTLLQSWTFLAKANLLQWRRLIHDFVNPRLRRFPQTAEATDVSMDLPILAESITPLWTADDAGEKSLLAGKIHNLRIAVHRVHGLEIGAGGLFSFWTQVGRAHRLKGYVLGRELREGCVVPAIAGGLCQLSNALYDSAARAGMDILERHTHTRIIPGSLAESGRDATVFWNYLDLRFTSDRRFRIEADLNSDSLRVRIRGPRAPEKAPAVPTGVVSLGPGKRMVSMHVPDNCWTCGVTECFRHKAHAGAPLDFGKTAFLVDEYWPEYDDYLKANAKAKDMLAIPMNGLRWGKPKYAWRTGGFSRVRSAWAVTAARAYQSRRLSGQGAARQRALLSFHEKLAAAYAATLTFDITHVTVMQNLLPFLWKSGHLGGRTFDVLMTALPFAHLHRRLDQAASLHPESPTLADFRAPEALVRLETEALRQARNIITPHPEIAALFPEKTELLAWKIPGPVDSAPSRAGGLKRGSNSGSKSDAEPESKPGTHPVEKNIFTIAFPAATVGRKGAYELRAALRLLVGGDMGKTVEPGSSGPLSDGLFAGEDSNGRDTAPGWDGLDLRLLCLGPQVEGGDFWGVSPKLRVETGVRAAGSLADADVVVLPAFIEHKPRRLLEALSRGIPVVATTACGLGKLPDAITIPTGDVRALAEALRKLMPVPAPKR